MKFGNILKAIISVVKANPMLVVGAVSAGKQIVKAVKDEAKGATPSQSDALRSDAISRRIDMLEARVVQTEIKP